jgi:hypothetical protein
MSTETEKTRLERIERGVLEGSRMIDDEIEDIVAAPHLFRSIKANIEHERSSPRSATKSLGTGWNWRLKLAVSGVLAVVLGIAVGTSFYSRKGPTAETAHEIQSQPETVGDQKPFDATPPTVAQEDSKIDQPVIQRAAVKVPPKAPRKARVEKVEEVSEFYPLTYTDDQDTNAEGSQVVRVELPRSSLVAMGVDPPVENDGQKVKTDLLIGSDGVMKAVRFVK